MKILIVAPMLPQARGPGAIPMLLNAQLLGLGARNEVSLVTGMGDEPWEPAAADAARQAAAHVYVADRRQPTDRRRRMQRRAALAGRWAFTRLPWRNLWFSPPAVQQAVDRALSETRFDVVAVEDSGMARVRLPPELPSVLTDHEVVRARPQPAALRGGLAGAVRGTLLEEDWRRAQRFQAAMWQRYRRVQVFTQQEADAITSLAPPIGPRVRVNPFGISIPPPCDPQRQVDGTVLFLGNFTHPPNRDAAHWLAREIMPLVWGEHPEARLSLVGSDPPPDVTGLARSGIEVIANVPDTEPFLERAAVCAAPVRLGGGMRVKVLTALARGKAVVTTGRGAHGFPSEAGERAMLVADDATGLAAAISRALGEPTLRRTLGQAARSMSIERYSPEAWAARLERVYAEAMEAPATVPDFVA